MGGHDGISIDHPVLIVMYLVYWQGRQYQQPISVLAMESDKSIETEPSETQTNDDHLDTSLDEPSPTHTDKQQQQRLEVNPMNHDAWCIIMYNNNWNTITQQRQLLLTWRMKGRNAFNKYDE